METPTKFEIHITKNQGMENDGFEEALMMPDFNTIKLNFMGITNAFLQAATCLNIGQNLNRSDEILRELISNCYLNISEDLLVYAANEGALYLPALFEVPLLVFKDLHMFDLLNDKYMDPTTWLGCFMNEFRILILALKEWVLFSSNVKRSPSERFLIKEPDGLPVPLNSLTTGPYLARIAQNLEGDNKAHFKDIAVLYTIKHFREYSLRQSFTGHSIGEKLLKTKEDPYASLRIKEKIKIFSKIYTSINGLLPLAWAEILYCVENELVIRICSECNNCFYIKGNGKYCSEDCKKEAKRKQDKKYYEQKRKS